MISKTSIMMVTYNRLELTKRTLKGLLESDPGTDYNLIIVDNGSTDGTLEYLKNLEKDFDKDNNAFPRIVCIETVLLPKNKGIAIGRNIALKKADDLETQWYCTLDNDVEMPDGWLNECIEILAKNRSYGGIGVNMERKQYPIVKHNGCVFQDKPQGNLGTACMVFPKWLHKMIGFFITTMGKYAHEDADWGMRTRVCGFKLGYIQRMGNHFGEGELDTGKYREFKTKQHQKNLAAFNANVRAYYRRQRPIYIPYKE